MKKIISITIAFVFLLLLTACGSPSQSAQQQEPAVVPENSAQAPTSVEDPVSEQEPADSDAPVPEEAMETTSLDDGVSPEFRETMDHYEAFFNDYAAFMKKYAETDDPTSMLLDYADFLEQYTELMAQLDAIEESELSEADAQYYLEVMTRINATLAEVTAQ